ncbi:MAG: hypothetical protein K8R23_06620 [Chthoniobacter sp.]|nr:hypothetical protein [Chthoniobacter sp.]
MITSNPRLSFHLDYGADAQFGGRDDLEICEQGMLFRSRWQFPIGTELSIAITHRDPRRGLRRMTLEGVVVGREPQHGHGCVSTLLFLELPDELRPSLREFSRTLATAG